ncbi:hypothetical protein AWC38_SpisGene18012 [Stylophora pistillata]|uniref:Uncharacterized protein n=1 Tax=Stylophora pistillata TaxID=50429 RepID=A0A2B4RMU6_STYPI|nr:hypothetical protein AWC38_SpisGene18012 [Stylophora pistillata]
MGSPNALREYFGNDDNSNTELDDDNAYKKPSNWTPSPGRDLALDCYLNGVERAILQHTPHNTQGSNIIRLEREAIKSLKRDNGIVIFQADKGAAVVVQNKRDYLTEAYKQVNGTDENGNKIYKHVASDPMSDFVIRVKETVQEAHSKGVINSNTTEYLVMENAQPGNIYFLPKIHKPQRPPPARPICNTVKSATTNISKWIDDQLQPLVEKLPSHLKDNNDFLCKLVELNKSHTLPPETTLVTWDARTNFYFKVILPSVTYGNTNHHLFLWMAVFLENDNKTQILHDVTSSVAEILHYVTSSAAEIRHDVTSSAAEILHDVTSSATEILHDVPLSASEILHDVTSSAAEILHDVTSSAAETLNDVTSSVAETLHYVTSSAAEILHDVTSSAAETLNDVTSSAAEILHGVPSSASEILRDVTLSAAEIADVPSSAAEILHNVTFSVVEILQ